MDNRHNEVEDASGLLSRTFVVLCLVYFLNSFLSSPFSALFPVYIEADLARPPWFTGYLRGLVLLLGGIFAVVAGRFCDRFGLKMTLMIGLAGSALPGLVFRTGDPVGLSLLLFMMGAASGPWSTAGQSILIRAVKPTHLGLGGALYFLSNTLGNSLGSLCTGLIKTDWSFAQIGVVMSVGMLGVIALAGLFLPGDRTPVERAKMAESESLWAAYKPLLARGEIWLLLSLRLTVYVLGHGNAGDAAADLSRSSERVYGRLLCRFRSSLPRRVGSGRRLKRPTGTREAAADLRSGYLSERGEYSFFTIR